MLGSKCRIVGGGAILWVVCCFDALSVCPLAASQAEFQGIEVEYITMPGWKSSTEKARAFSDLPANAQNYVRKVEELLEVPGKKTAR